MDGHPLPRTIALAIALALVAPGTAAPARAGAIAGVVRGPALAPTAPLADPYPGRASSLPGRRAVARGGMADGVVWLARIPAETDSALRRERRRPRLVQRDQTFAPRVLAVAAGATVDFPNEDPIFHNVFSLSPVRRFDLGKYGRGQSRAVAFGRPGIVPVFCDIHADMAAWIVVTPNAAYARPDESGAFRLPPVPAGRYALHVWHPDFGELVRDVDVPESGDATLEVTLR